MITSVEDLNVVLSKVIGDHMQTLYFKSKKDVAIYRSYHDGESIEDDNESRNSIEKSRLLSSAGNLITESDKVLRDLFLWSVLMNSCDMAKALLAHMKYRICSALIATKILKEYHSKADRDDTRNAYWANATYFEQYAINCLSACQKNDQDKACELVLQQIELYGRVTCLQV
jgi:hypothetical protein